MSSAMIARDTGREHRLSGAGTRLQPARRPTVPPRSADLDPSVWTGPTSGHLHVFCDIDPESNSIDGAGACAILHTPAGAELNVRRFPSDLHQDNRIPQRMVKPREGLTLPDEDAPLMRPLGLGFSGERRSDFEELWKLKKRLHAEQGWHHAAGQLLGWPTWQNDDNMGYLASLRDGHALEWTLLLQTDALDAELYVVLPTADQAAARFDRAEAIIEHDRAADLPTRCAVRS
jgi:hypothetical protein